MLLSGYKRCEPCWIHTRPAIPSWNTRDSPNPASLLQLRDADLPYPDERNGGRGLVALQRIFPCQVHGARAWSTYVPSAVLWHRHRPRELRIALTPIMLRAPTPTAAYMNPVLCSRVTYRGAQVVRVARRNDELVSRTAERCSQRACPMIIKVSGSSVSYLGGATHDSRRATFQQNILHCTCDTWMRVATTMRGLMSVPYCERDRD